MTTRMLTVALGLVLCGAFAVVIMAAAEEAVTEKTGDVGGEKAGEGEAKWALAVDPKPLSDNVKKGLSWLAEHQLKNGAWGQGEESSQMGGGAQIKDAPSVGDTCMGALALVRSGSSPSEGQYRAAIRKAVEYVCSEVENSDKDSLWVTSTRGTRIQSKLGQNIDTFMACLLLSEVKGRMPDKESNDRISTALEKVLHKMKTNQKGNGTWGDKGWAPALAMNVATKGYNRAAQAGADVDESVRQRAEQYSQEQYDQKSGKFTGADSAGVQLYSAAGSIGGQSDSVNTNATLEAKARKDAKEADTAEEREVAQKKLDRYAEAKVGLAKAQDAIVAKLDDKQFIAGFGSNGGEEFLSYMNIGEALVVKGGDNWKKWDTEMTKNLNRIQNKDGSWSGHHCITGRTFCTSASLLVLMVDRTPVPIAAKIGRR